MMINIDWKQSSTKRGAVWLVAGIVGAAMLMAGKDIQQLLVLASAVAGGLGVAIKD